MPCFDVDYRGTDGFRGSDNRAGIGIQELAINQAIFGMRWAPTRESVISGAEIQPLKRRQRKYTGIPLAIIRNATVEGPGWVIQVLATNQAATVMKSNGVAG